MTSINNYCAWSSDKWVKVSVYDIIVVENRKEGKTKSKKFLYEISSKNGLGLMPGEVLTSFILFDAHRNFSVL